MDGKRQSEGKALREGQSGGGKMGRKGAALGEGV